MGNDLSAHFDTGQAEKEKASGQRKGGGRLERLDSALTKFVQQGVDYSLRVLVLSEYAILIIMLSCLCLCLDYYFCNLFEHIRETIVSGVYKHYSVTTRLA